MINNNNKRNQHLLHINSALRKKVNEMGKQIFKGAKTRTPLNNNYTNKESQQKTNKIHKTRQQIINISKTEENTQNS